MEFYPPVSIIIVNYNGIRYIQRTLQALDILTYPNLEIIVVDNGSSDGSVEYLSKLNNVTLVISPKKAEKNFACNYAVTQAKGEYLLMLDNDLLINTPDFIQSVVHDYSSLQDIGTFGFVFRNEGEELIRNYGIYLGLFFDRPLKAIKEHQILPHHGHEIGYAAGAIIFVKKTVWQQVGGYDDHLQFGGDDNDLGMKMWLFGYKNYLYAKSVQLHIGLPERSDVKKWALKNRKMTHAHFYTIVKNYNHFNVLFYVSSYFMYSFTKSLYQCFKRRSAKPITSWFGGVVDFVFDLSAAFAARRKMQSARIVDRDLFMVPRPPSL